MGAVYLIQAGEEGPVKIGFTAVDPQRRLAQLQTASPYRLSLRFTIHGDVTSEKHLQTRFADYRLEGEWFEPRQDIFAAFEAAVEWPETPRSLPPTTPDGIDLLRHCVLTDIRPRYPDGSKHIEIDWDLIAADIAAYLEEAA